MEQFNISDHNIDQGFSFFSQENNCQNFNPFESDSSFLEENDSMQNQQRKEFPFENKILIDAYHDYEEPMKRNEDGPEEKSFLSHKRKSSFNIDELKKEENKNMIDSTKKETKESSTNIILKNVKFKCSKSRNDYLIKKFKGDCFSNYVTQKLHKMATYYKFPPKKKIYKPNHSAFTSVSNYKKNLNFLSWTLEKAFSYNAKKVSIYQKKNKKLFRKIFGSRNVNRCKKIKKFLKMTVEDVIKEYYNSEDFAKFCLRPDIQEYDKEFKKEKKFSFLEKYGFLKLIRNQY